VGTNALLILYYALVAACVGLSGYLSYFGYRSSLDEMALPFTIIICLGLFAADVVIQKRREANRSIVPGLAFFAFVAIFSWASNFNHVYSNFMQKDVVRSALDSQYARFNDNLTETSDALDDLPIGTAVAQRRLELQREIARLRAQTTDPLRYGCGERCRQHLDAIQAILGKPLTGVAIPGIGSPERVVSEWLDRVAQQATNDFERAVSTSGYEQFFILREDIDRLLVEYESPDRSMAAMEGLDVLRLLASESDAIERRANTFLPEDDRVEHAPIDTTLGRLGEISYAIENAFVDRPNLFATAVSAIVSLAVDILPVFFALIALSTNGVATAGRRLDMAGAEVLD
jgi:hypothetical protein